MAPTVRYSTFTSYESHVKRHVIPALGDLELDQIRPQQLNAFYASRTAAGLSAGTVRRIHATLRRALRDAVRWGEIGDNPAAGSDPPRVGEIAKFSTWEPEHVRAFLEAVIGDELEALWVVLATTGLRRGEALGLKWRDVDLARGTVAIRQTVIELGGRATTSTPKTARGRRVVAIDPYTIDKLRRHTGGSHSDGWVFGNNEGDVLPPGSISRRFQAIVATAGLPRIRLHDLRHTHGTLALRAGVHPKIVSERLGHATVAFTLDVYSHSIPHLQEEAAVKVAALVVPADPASGSDRSS